MFTFHDAGRRSSRREWLRVGSLGVCGVTLPGLLASQQARAAGSGGRAKSCIVILLLGGPPQQETWDPKPDSPGEYRGEGETIATKIPGYRIGESMPRIAEIVDKLTILRACRTQDNAHSTSGYAMTTGVAHIPMQLEGASPGAPNNWPNLGGIIRYLKPAVGAIPSAITLPEIAANDGNKTWPGQDAGFLGRGCDPWLLNGDPNAASFEVPDLAIPTEVGAPRFDSRTQLLSQLDRRVAHLERGGSLDRFNVWQQQALDMVRSPQSRRAFDLNDESNATRDRYGRTRFGQSVLLARRLVEAGVSLVQVNWPRLDGAPNNGTWDTHTKNGESVIKHLMPPTDVAFSALIEDLEQRGLLDETLVVLMGEFGRSPKINGAGGRDHWGNVFSIAMAGGGVKRGVIYGESDRLAAEPVSGLVRPADFTATLFHCLGYTPETTLRDLTGREQPISRGRVVREILG